MKPNSLSLKVVDSVYGPLYQIVTSTGIVLAESYNLAAASICLDALNQRYPAD